MRHPAVEVVRLNIADPTIHAGIAVNVRDVRVVDNRYVVAVVSAIVATAPPPVVRLVRCQRNPTDIAITKANSTSSAKADEAHQRRRPIVLRSVCARPPAPASAIVKPPAVVIGSPSPGVITNPAPAIPIDPGPAPIPIRGPVSRHSRPPHIPVGGAVHPLTGRVQLLAAINALRHILLAARRLQFPIARLVPLVPAIQTHCVRNLKASLRSVPATANRERLASPQLARALRRVDIHFAFPNCNLGRTVLQHLHAILALSQRANAHRRRIEVNLSRRILQYPEGHQTDRKVHLITLALHLGQPHFSVRPDPHHVGTVELQLCPRSCTRHQPVLRHQGRVDRRGHAVTAIPSPHGDFSGNYTHSRNTPRGIVVLR